MRLHRFILRPSAPWATPLRSDTLYGLLLWRLAERDGDGACARAIAAFREGEPPWVLSSVLPEGMLFAPCLPPIPRGRFRDWVRQGEFVDRQGQPLTLFQALQCFKKFRKQHYLRLSLWQQEARALSVRRLLQDFCSHSPQDFCRAPSPYPTNDSLEPHVSIDRRNGGAREGGLYFNRLHWFQPGQVLHCYARTDRPEDLLDLLDKLGELGFGKDAALGKGRFSVALDPGFAPETLENLGPWRLSLSVAAAQDMTQVSGWYAIETKRGKVGPSGLSPFKNPLLLLREGSLLKRLPQGPGVLQIHPDTRIVQVTLPLLLPCALTEEV